MSHLIRLSIALALVLAAAGGAALAGPDRTGTCVHAVVPGDVVLPDGAVAHDPELKLCFTREFTPVAGLHATYVDGRPIGLFPSVRRVSEGASPGGRPLVVLRRGDGGTLWLHAYAVPAGDRMVTYRLEGFDAAMAEGPGAAEPFEIGSLLRDGSEEFTVVAALP